MRRVPRRSERLHIASPSRLQNKRCEVVDYSLRTSGDSSYRRQVVGTYQTCMQSRIHPIYRLERQKRAEKKGIRPPAAARRPPPHGAAGGGGGAPAPPPPPPAQGP